MHATHLSHDPMLNSTKDQVQNANLSTFAAITGILTTHISSSLPKFNASDLNICFLEFVPFKDSRVGFGRRCSTVASGSSSLFEYLA